MPYAPADWAFDSPLTAPDPHLWGLFISCAVRFYSIAIGDPWKALWFHRAFVPGCSSRSRKPDPTPWQVGLTPIGLPLHRRCWPYHHSGAGKLAEGSTGMLFFIPLCSADPPCSAAIREKPAGEQGSPTGENGGTASPTLPAVSVLSAALICSKTDVSNWAAQFYAQLTFLLTRILVSAMLYLTRIIVIFDLDHCQERG